MTSDQTKVRKGRKFDQVLAGARDVFMADGFEGASVDAIARAAGVSKATLYSYVISHIPAPAVPPRIKSARNICGRIRSSNLRRGGSPLGRGSEGDIMG